MNNSSIKFYFIVALALSLVGKSSAQPDLSINAEINSGNITSQFTTYVNPFLGTAPLTNPADIGFTPPWRVWAGLVFPGASLPNAMVQLTPITKFGSGAVMNMKIPLFTLSRTPAKDIGICATSRFCRQPAT